ncbi:hypothetical protein H1P_290029 [Hyella patelloides LEGE 07179]|uniref:Uncharacterized protein n=1 Tax=Hyella patelloides LEGE 07179 TaxID=945734 RepID=A0A563VTQ6_9CYAN|nr:hypothetical protein H1P_290029 [Hyella patelloides LEGE 07179]
MLSRTTMPFERIAETTQNTAAHDINFLHQGVANCPYSLA